jgi:hypothetical protein
MSSLSTLKMKRTLRVVLAVLVCLGDHTIIAWIDCTLACFRLMHESCLSHGGTRTCLLQRYSTNLTFDVLNGKLSFPSLLEEMVNKDYLIVHRAHIVV